MKSSPLAVLLALQLILLPSAAMAHAGHDVSGGFAHPFTGLDHLLAMVAVGVLAARSPARRVWLYPAVFVAAMAAGGGLGLAGVWPAGLEAVVAASVVVIGLLLAAGPRIGAVPTAVLLGLAGLAHGLAHGAEAPAGADRLLYMGGFLAATLVLHAGGALIGRAARPGVAVATGGAITMVGAALLAGVA